MWFDPSPHARARRLLSVIDFDEVVVLVFVLIVVVLIIFVVVILVNLIEDVEGEFHAQLGEEDIVVGEEGVAQRHLTYDDILFTQLGVELPFDILDDSDDEDDYDDEEEDEEEDDDDEEEEDDDFIEVDD